MADQYAAHKASSEQPAMDPRPSPSALSHEACILRHVSRVSRAVVAAYDPALTPFGLTGHQFNLMMTLGNMGPMTVGALADTLGMDASGVPRAVRPLADDGMISIERGADRRQRVLSLTVLGRTRLERATPAWSCAGRAREHGRRAALASADERVARGAESGHGLLDAQACAGRQKILE